LSSLLEYYGRYLGLPVHAFDFLPQDEIPEYQYRERRLLDSYLPGRSRTICALRAAKNNPRQSKVMRLGPLANAEYKIQYLAGWASWSGQGTPWNQRTDDTTKTHPTGEPLPLGAWWYYACPGLEWNWTNAVRLPGSTLGGFGSQLEAENYGRADTPATVTATDNTLLLFYADDLYQDNRGAVVWQLARA
jgi:hypothetical protein